jgi:biopolymer transport protein TolQ
MTALDFLSAAAADAPTRLDPVRLFLDADIVVQAVMVGLILASIWSWMIMIGFMLRMKNVRQRGDQFEAEFWQADQFDEMMKRQSKRDVPLARVAGAGMAEWRRSTKGPVADRDGVRQRLAGAMESQVAEETDSLAQRLTFLATVGSVAPFVGLFGTVWGIMNSFFQIGAQQNSSLAVVAPGISEALFATAIGLFAAIPAVIGYNRFSQALNSYEAKMQRFADKFHASLSRQLEKL